MIKLKHLKSCPVQLTILMHPGSNIVSSNDGASKQSERYRPVFELVNAKQQPVLSDGLLLWQWEKDSPAFFTEGRVHTNVVFPVRKIKVFTSLRTGSRTRPRRVRT